MMATISFKEDLIIDDQNKIKEIAQALKQHKDSKIKSAQPTKLLSLIHI